MPYSPDIVQIEDSWGKMRFVRRRLMPETLGYGRTVEAADEFGNPMWGRLISVGPVAPENPQVGDLWINTNP